jgi:hypothetical protein
VDKDKEFNLTLPKASEEQKTIALVAVYTDATQTLTLEDMIAIEEENEKED